ncbi:MAG TPA: hypothetical protein PKW15_05455 [Alphaproteobacteria bacterium]|nr:hypothetical protein [Rhodospirillaceae bacterium]HRJ12672.1 hypothetical protein [Alphaproteobacteria bacterium]
MTAKTISPQLQIIRRVSIQPDRTVNRFGFGDTVGVTADQFNPGLDPRKYAVEPTPVVRYGFGDAPVHAVYCRDPQI